MTERDRSFFQQGINMYVKACQYITGLQIGEPQTYSLGSPAASNATLIQTTIAANSVANTDATPASVYVADAPYGRTLIYTPSGNPGNSNTVVVYGQDYLGQPMLELFTGASGSTAVLYGKKAFFRVLKSRVLTPASNAVTYSIGTGTQLGLPYKGRVMGAHENGVWVPVYNQDFQLYTTFSVADAVAGGSLPVVSPCPGYVKNLFGAGTTTGTAGNDVMTASIGGTAITGLTINIANNTATYVTGNPTTAGYNANNRLVTNGPVILIAAALASAKGFYTGVTITPTQNVLPDQTDPATTITGDPRGTYDPLTAPSGVPITVELIGDPSVSATTGNGGYHGIQQYFSAAGT